MSTPAVVSVSQYDVGRPLVFKVYDGTSPADLTGVTAVIEGTKKSGLGFSESGTVTDNTVTLNTTLAMTQEDGSIPAEIRFSKTGEDVGTANFILAVEKTPHAEGTTDGTTETMADLQSQLDALDTRVEALEAGGGGGGLTEAVKSAMLQIAQKVAYIDEHGQTYYNALYNALYPPAELVSITAVYTQSGTVYDMDTLDSLKPDLVVTAYYDNQTSAVVTNYTLSGTLTEGTSTITVSYGGKTATFDVTVVHQELPAGYTKYDYLTQTGFSGSFQAKEYGIWTNAQMSTDYTLEMKFFASSSAGSTGFDSPPLIGTRGGASGTKEIALFYKPKHNRLGYWFDGTDSSNQPPAPSKDVLHIIKIKPVGASATYPNNVTIDIDGTEYDTGSASTGKMFDSWFGIFTYAISSNMGITNNDVMFVGQQIGEILVTDSNGDAVYDFVPAKDSSDRYGYYEKVGGVFYYNATYATTNYIGGYWE